MTTQTAAVYSPQPGNTYLNGIWWDTRWVTNGIPSGQTVITFAGSAKYKPNAAEIAAYTQIFSDISAICNISFVSGTAAAADLIMNSGTTAQMQAVYPGISTTTLGIADPPGTSINKNTGDEASWVFVNRTKLPANSFNKGGYAYMVMMHEIGHALGLAHPHDNGGNSSIFPGVAAASDLGPDGLNQGIFTTMSYNAAWAPYSAYLSPQYGYQGTMMAFDIAALQAKYGANMSTATGSDTYALSDTGRVGSFLRCIWDAGGNDSIYYGGPYAAVVDLRAATLASGYGAGGFVSYVPGVGMVYNAFTIAHGATIENGLTGSGNDTLVGNEVSNFLFSGDGSDTVYGLEQGDFIMGGGGDDAIYGGSSYDNMLGGSGNDSFYGGSENDYFNLATDVVAGQLDMFYDFTAGEDYVLIPASSFASLFFGDGGGTAYGYALLAGGGYYVFGATGITAAQLQAFTIVY